MTAQRETVRRRERRRRGSRWRWRGIFPARSGETEAGERAGRAEGFWGVAPFGCSRCGDRERGGLVRMFSLFMNGIVGGCWYWLMWRLSCDVAGKRAGGRSGGKEIGEEMCIGCVLVGGLIS